MDAGVLFEDGVGEPQGVHPGIGEVKAAMEFRPAEVTIVEPGSGEVGLGSEMSVGDVGFPVKLGLGHIAFAEVKLSDTREAALSAFANAVLQVREIEECHMIASSFDYLLKVRTADIHSYRRVLGEKISSLPHVASTSTFVVMESVIDMGS